MDPTQEDLFTTSLDFGNVTIGGETMAQTTYTLSDLDYTSNTITVSPTWIGTNGTFGSYNWANTGPSATLAQSGRLSLTGQDADIEINGESLMAMMHRIEERLNILRPNPTLESEWDQLHELGQQYRALEKKLTEQKEMWDALKKMPPPEIK